MSLRRRLEASVGGSGGRSLEWALVEAGAGLRPIVGVRGGSTRRREGDMEDGHD